MCSPNSSAYRNGRRCPAATLPKRLQPYRLTFDADGKPMGLQADRYDALAAELQAQWLAFNRELKQASRYT